MCELCGPVVIACQAAPALQLEAAAHGLDAVGRAGRWSCVEYRGHGPLTLRASQLRPAPAGAGRANSRNVTSEDTGLPGRPNTSVAPRVPRQGRLAGAERHTGETLIDAEGLQDLADGSCVPTTCRR